ncbi:signal recognition particle subunit SRP14 [[Emmonsia] crescens]|uniref:Signal recognition particle subunit SRP14 n=1 Tax=[Emmonsia] crescens TaxID=73230 RepID=A0A2B7ZR95_9EURO|nr:signal recognition particle subunit SRP14 [Emmonsia crescens]
MSSIPHLSNDEFFTALKALLTTQSTKALGSVFLTQKRLPTTSISSPSEDTTSTSTSTPTPTTPSPTLAPAPILVRATNGRHKGAKSKVSTIVQPDDIEGFFVKYAELCKMGMVGMKKRDRSGRKKGKGKGAKGKA